MEISPVAYLVFFVLWAAASVLVAYVWYAFTQERRYVGLVCACGALFILGAGGLAIVGQWNDATAASSLLHQRVYLCALGCGTLVSSVAIGLRVCRSRFAISSAQAGVASMLLALGIGVGTTDFADARFGEIFTRFTGAWVVLLLAASALSRSIRLAPARAGATPTSGRTPRLDAAPSSVDRGG